MRTGSPAVILYDSNGNELNIVEDTLIGSSKPGLLIAGKRDSDDKSQFLRISSEGYLWVTPYTSSDDPAYVIISQGARSFYCVGLINAATPAVVESTTESFNVGGTTLTIDVNGTTQYSAYPTRGATAGIHYSGPNPATSNSNKKKFKCSIDGGAIKEVQIDEDLTSGDAIAASLQTQIRALVENGASATVQYNAAGYPFRYLFTSGTTGSSSSFLAYPSGDDLDELLKVDGFGGTSIDGLAANYYWAYEVASMTATNLTDVVVADEGGVVKIQTVLGGSSATLQVTAGGANTALQFPTTLVTGINGSGSSNMNVDGSSTSVRFEIPIPSGYTFYVTKVIIRIRSDGKDLNKFASLSELTNGVLLQYKNLDFPISELCTLKTNGDILSKTIDGSIIADAFASGGKHLVIGTFEFSAAGLRLPYGSDANFYITIRDDLSSLNEFTAKAVGWIEK
jgi:hypothetical protein